MRSQFPAVDAGVTLVDTFIRVDHASHPEIKLIDLLQVKAVYSHAYVAGELTMETFRNCESAAAPKIAAGTAVSAAELLQFCGSTGYTEGHRLH